MKYFEVVFDIAYLLIVLYLGFKLLKKDTKLATIFGAMALILGFGDMFHLIPRVVGHLTTGLDDYTFWLGMGSGITSLTMTVFYYLLLKAYEHKFGVNKIFRYVVIVLLLFKVVITFFPQNNWFTNDAEYSFQLIRNIPFMFMGLYMVYEILRQKDSTFTKIGIGVLLSFLFYMPVIFFAEFLPIIGMLMMPKTVAYLYVIIVAYREL